MPDRDGPARPAARNGAWSADDAAVVATDADGTLVVRRGERFLLALTMGERPVELPAGRVLLASGPLSDGRIPPDTGVWIDLRGLG